MGKIGYMEYMELERQHRELINRVNKCKRNLQIIREKHKKQLLLRKIIVILGIIICLSIFLYTQFRKEYNFTQAEIMFDMMIVTPLKIIAYVMAIVSIYCMWELFIMTRKTHIIIFNRKIYRGTLDEIDKLRNELAKAERDLEKFEDIYKAELVNGINVPKNDE